MSGGNGHVTAASGTTIFRAGDESLCRRGTPGKGAGMKCTQRDEDLQAFFDGELDASRAASFRQHVAECPSCQSRLQFFQDVRSELRAHAAAYKAPAHVKEQIGRYLRQLERRRQREWKAVAALAIIALF